MARSTRKPPAIPADDPRVVKAAAAGRLRAEEVWTAGGWRKAPAQCPICMELLRDAKPGESMAIMGAWLDAYRGRCDEFARAAIAAGEAA